MQRDLNALAETSFDVVVIGGGIYGAFTAWDAARRGLSVALIEQGDWGGATSSNSLKIAHGGLRYLQSADFKRMRESIRERRILMAMAPHLVHPMACMLPTLGHFSRGPEAMAAAMLLNDFVGSDRDQGLDAAHKLPPGGVISREEAMRRIPGVSTGGLTGAACWYDGLIHNPDRLVLAVVASAVDAGAVAANHLEATGVLMDGGRVAGVTATDRLDGGAIEIRARVTLNCAGPWANRVLGLARPDAAPLVQWSWAMNLVTRRVGTHEAFAVWSPYRITNGKRVRRPKPQALFVVPWRDVTIIGTMHRPHPGPGGAFAPGATQVDDFIDEINHAWPGVDLTRRDVKLPLAGLLPMTGMQGNGEVGLSDRAVIVDHGAHGLPGLISTVGVKFTTSRNVAERLVNAAFAALGTKTPPPCTTTTATVHGGDVGDWPAFVAAARAEVGDAPWLEQLLRSHGSRWRDVLADLDRPFDSVADVDILEAQAAHAVRHEMAHTLADVVRRRTELGSAGAPGREPLARMAAVMACQMGWDAASAADQVNGVHALYGFPS